MRHFQTEFGLEEEIIKQNIYLSGCSVLVSFEHSVVFCVNAACSGMEENSEKPRLMGFGAGICENVRCWDGCDHFCAHSFVVLVPIRFHVPVPLTLQPSI